MMKLAILAATAVATAVAAIVAAIAAVFELAAPRFGRGSGLGLGDTAKDGDRLFLHPVAKRAAVDERPDVGKRALVRVAAVGVVTVRVGMAVLMRVLVAFSWQEMDVELDSFNVRLAFAADVQLVTAQIQLRQFALEHCCIDADVDHCAEKHVAADAAENIKVKCLHQIP